MDLLRDDQPLRIYWKTFTMLWKGWRNEDKSIQYSRIFQRQSTRCRIICSYKNYEILESEGVFYRVWQITIRRYRKHRVNKNYTNFQNFHKGQYSVQCCFSFSSIHCPQYSNPHNHLFFADDLKLHEKIQNDDDCKLLLEDINSLSHWCTTHKVYIYLKVEKCFSLTTTNKTIFIYSIDDTNLKALTVKSDLGITFDDKLSFNQHIDTIIRKAYKILGFIFRSAKHFKTPKILP